MGGTLTPGEHPKPNAGLPPANGKHQRYGGSHGPYLQARKFLLA